VLPGTQCPPQDQFGRQCREKSQSAPCSAVRSCVGQQLLQRSTAVVVEAAAMVAADPRRRRRVTPARPSRWWPARLLRRTPAAARVRRKWFVLFAIRLQAQHRTGRCTAAEAATGRPDTIRPRLTAARPAPAGYCRCRTAADPAQLVDELHQGKITRGLFDHRHVVDRF
jgi:hypothetical protein